MDVATVEPNVRRVMLQRIAMVAISNDFHKTVFRAIRICYTDAEKLTPSGKRTQALIPAAFSADIEAHQWVVVVNQFGELVGFIAIVDTTGVGLRGKHISWLFVIPSMRRSNIGTLLIDAAEKIARAGNSTHMTVDVDVDIGVMRFALARGFSFPDRRVYATLGDTLIDVQAVHQLMDSNAKELCSTPRDLEEDVTHHAQRISEASEFVRSPAADAAEFSRRFAKFVKHASVHMTKLIAERELTTPYP